MADLNLSEIFIEHPFVLVDKDKLKNVLADFYMGDTARVNRMMRAYEIGVISMLSMQTDIEIEKKKIISSMVMIHDMQEEKAREAVDEWERICTKEVISKYIDFIQEKDWSSDEESKIKCIIEKQLKLYDEIYNIDKKFAELMTSQLHLSPETWGDVIALCEKQISLFEECYTNKWPIPLVKHRQIDLIKKQISIYQIMLNLDATISSAGTDLTILKDTQKYIECCSSQAYNINLCKQNGWGVPI